MRNWFGGSPSDWTMEIPDALTRDILVKGGVALTFWSAPTGGFQYSDLLLNGSPVTTIYTGDGTSVPLGQVPEFQGPDEDPPVREMYAQANSATYRFKMPATNVGGLLYTHETGTDPHGDRAYTDTQIAALSAAGATPRPASAVVYASGVPSGLKAAAGTYTFHCDGTADQVEINNAIDAITAVGGGDVYLVGPQFNIAASILLTSGTWLRGQGVMTELRASGNFSDAIIKLKTVNDHYVKVSDLQINGNWMAVHGISLDNQAGDLSGKPTSSPDSAHVLSDMFIQQCGSASFPGYGIVIKGNNNRANKVGNIRIQNCTASGVWTDVAGDLHFTNVEVGGCGKLSPATSTSSTGPIGQGFYISSGNTMLSQCKAYYSRDAGFHIRGQRAQLNGCQSQDNYAAGFNMAGGKALAVGCVADSNGQSVGANGQSQAGFRIASGNNILEGCMSFDRGGQAWVQQYGFHFVSGVTYCRVTGTTYSNGTASIQGTPDASNVVAILADAGGK